MILAVEIVERTGQAFTEFFGWVPNLLGAVVVLVLGWLVARVLSRVVSFATHRAGVDRTLSRGTVGQWVARATHSPSQLLGTLTFWVVMFGAVSLAATVLGIEALEALVAAIYAYIPNVIAAALIFVVAVAISAGVSALATRVMGDTALGKIVATAAPILVMTVATFMILDQLQIAENIVTITYAGLIGAVALGSALAFGLGGREVASRMLESVYQTGQERKHEFKRDLDQGIRRAREEATERPDETRRELLDRPAPPVGA